MDVAQPRRFVGCQLLIAQTLSPTLRTVRLPSPRRLFRSQRARLGTPKAITAAAHKPARILYNLMRHGIDNLGKEEEAYAQQVRDRLEKQLRRSARELGFEVNKLQNSTLTFPDGEVVTVDPHGEIINGK